MQLQVGDVIYTRGGKSKSVITRVTAKRAYVRVSDTYEIEFDREVSSELSFQPRGADTYCIDSYSVETPELVAKYKRYRDECQFSSIKVKSLTDSQLESILNLVKRSHNDYY